MRMIPVMIRTGSSPGHPEIIPSGDVFLPHPAASCNRESFVNAEFRSCI